MDRIEVYAFEDADGNEFESYTTTDLAEARRYAAEAKLRLVARVYEYADTELVDDFTDEVELEGNVLTVRDREFDQYRGVYELSDPLLGELEDRGFDIEAVRDFLDEYGNSIPKEALS